MVDMTLTMRVWGLFVISRLILNIAYMCTKFEDTSFIRSKDMMGSKKRDTRP